MQCYEKEETRRLIEELRGILTSPKLSNTKDSSTIQENSSERLESQFEVLNSLMRSELDNRVKDFDKHNWTIPVRRGEIDITKIVEKCVDIIALAKDFVGMALSTNPQVALAWAAVCFGL
jgi:hypothetical protein